MASDKTPLVDSDPLADIVKALHAQAVEFKAKNGRTIHWSEFKVNVPKDLANYTTRKNEKGERVAKTDSKGSPMPAARCLWYAAINRYRPDAEKGVNTESGIVEFHSAASAGYKAINKASGTRKGRSAAPRISAKTAATLAKGMDVSAL